MAEFLLASLCEKELSFVENPNFLAIKEENIVSPTQRCMRSGLPYLMSIGQIIPWN